MKNRRGLETCQGCNGLVEVFPSRGQGFGGSGSGSRIYGVDFSVQIFGPKDMFTGGLGLRVVRVRDLARV